MHFLFSHRLTSASVGALLLVASSIVTAQTTWVFLANEWSSFNLSAPQRVRYGANSTWVERDLSAGGGQCTNAFFGGDPLPGIVKQCEAQQGAPQGSWNFLSSEWSAFTLSSPQRVRYGANSTWVERSLPAGSGQCTNAFFGGDPLPGIVKRCEVFAGGTPPPGSIAVDARVDSGVADERRRVVTHTSTQLNADESAFRVNCAISHFSKEDPIVYPGVAPALDAHQHMFFGNTATDRYLDASNIRSAGKGTCSGGTLNRSAYWVPSMLNGSGQLVLPYEVFVYYKSGGSGIPRERIESVLPPGLRMVNGDPHGSEARPDAFECISKGFRIGYGSQIPAACAGDTLQQKVVFPQCWNGNLDSANHRDHMAWPRPVSPTSTAQDCPSSHPRAIPEITFILRYSMSPSVNISTWRLSSDTNPSARGITNHGDWFNGWDPATSTTWLTNCTRRPANNLNDCRVDLLGDGTELFYRN